MFYAIEHAYGPNVANVDGARSDRVLEFTARRLRDAWIADGQPDHRAVIGARHPKVRKAVWLENGDSEAWRAIAEQRVLGTAALTPYHYELIQYDWGDLGHAKWIATASEGEIVSWAKNVRANAEDA